MRLLSAADSSLLVPWLLALEVAGMARLLLLVTGCSSAVLYAAVFGNDSADTRRLKHPFRYASRSCLRLTGRVGLQSAWYIIPASGLPPNCAGFMSRGSATAAHSSATAGPRELRPVGQNGREAVVEEEEEDGGGGRDASVSSSSARTL